MNTINRRTVLRGSLLLAGAGSYLSATNWHRAFAQATAPTIRPSASSAEGKQMLRIYAAAVQKMVDLSATDPGNPLGWTFQWYIHGVAQPWTERVSVAFKEPAIKRIYPSTADPRRAFAALTWDTCTHYGQPQMFFLPWHRMYVMRFEQLIRFHSGNPSFALPYWDYTNPNEHSIPPEFGMQNDPLFKSLFRAQRKLNINTGIAIDQGMPGSFLNLNDLSFATYLPRASGAGGFCVNLDANLHGNVHVNVGASPPESDLGMRFVPTAANDPLFWMHHCNIDRMWESWNRAGGLNPQDAPFLNAAFSFPTAPGGTPTAISVKDVLRAQQCGYAYSSYVDRPPRSEPFPKPDPTELASVRDYVTLASSGAIKLAAVDSRVQLRPTARAAAPSSSSLASTDAAGTAYLVLRGVTAAKDPGTSYAISLRPKAAGARGNGSLFVGLLNFFSTQAHGAVHHGTTLTFPIAHNAAAPVPVDLAGFEVELRPLQAPNKDSLPSIARVEIVTR